MESGETLLCSFICANDYPCDWSKWNNPVSQPFPDGSVQTCVGAQVRCGCTCAMRLVSFFTYEHPTSVVVIFFFIITFILIMTVKYLCRMSNCASLCCGRMLYSQKCSSQTQHGAPVNSSFNDLEREINCNIHVDDFQDCFTETEKPPSYTIATSHGLDCPPPPYSECLPPPTKC